MEKEKEPTAHALSHTKEMVKFLHVQIHCLCTSCLLSMHTSVANMGVGGG